MVIAIVIGIDKNYVTFQHFSVVLEKINAATNISEDPNMSSIDQPTCSQCLEVRTFFAQNNISHNIRLFATTIPIQQKELGRLFRTNCHTTYCSCSVVPKIESLFNSTPQL